MRNRPAGCRSTSRGTSEPGLVEIVLGQLHAETPGDGEEVDDCVGRAAERGKRHDGVEERAAAEQARRGSMRGHHLDGEPAGVMGMLEQAAVGGGRAREPGQHHAERLGEEAHRRGGAHGVAVARGSGSSTTPTRGSRSRSGCPARTSSESRQTSVPQPRAWPRNVPVSIGPPGMTTAGRSTDAAAMSNAGMVLSQPPSRTTPSIGLARNISSAAIAAMFRQSIAVGRTSVSPSDTIGQVQRNPACLVDALLDALGDLVQMRVAGREIGGSVCDGDMRPPVEGVRGESAPHPRPMDVGVAVVARVPLPAP